MRHIHKHSSFPLVVILLSLGLIVFMYYAFTQEPAVEPETAKPTPTNPEIIVEVNSDQYRIDLVATIDSFYSEFDNAQDDLSKLLVTEQVLGDLLEMNVPTEYKDLHLSLAVVFNQLETGLRSADRSVEQPLRELGFIQMEYPWLIQ